MSAHHDIPAEMGISEAELSGLTRDLDDMHQDSMSQVRENMTMVSDRVASATRTFANRRTFLLGGAAIAGSAAVAACGGGSSGGGSAPSSNGGGSPSGNGNSQYTGDLQVVALAAALENLAVAGYGLVLKSATMGKYGKVPPAIATFAKTVQKQHADHAKEWNSVLTQNNKPTIKGTPLSITTQTVNELKKAKTLPAVANVALSIENAAAQTYVFAAANVMDPGGIMVAATIAPVESMHAAILSFVLGKYPVPNADIGITKAVPPSALTA